MKTSTLIYKLRKQYPENAGFEGDFIGLQTGELKKETKTIVLCLDFDNDVYQRIKNRKVDLILTHHPLIYGFRDEVLGYDKVKEKLVNIIDKRGIPVYSMHTNFDGAEYGMNYALAKSLHLKNIRYLETEKLLRGGDLEKPMEIHQFTKYAKRCLKLDYVGLINRGKKVVQKVAICGGAGAGCFRAAMNEGYDVFLSGDAPHNIRHDINCYKYNYIEIAHEVEKIFIPTVHKYLKSIDKSLEIIDVDTQRLMKIF